jgi:hypothetical protein
MELTARLKPRPFKYGAGGNKKEKRGEPLFSFET